MSGTDTLGIMKESPRTSQLQLALQKPRLARYVERAIGLFEGESGRLSGHAGAWVFANHAAFTAAGQLKKK